MKNILDDIFIALGTIAFLIVVGTLTFIGLQNMTDPNEVICTYEGGNIHGDVCIVDGKVFNIKDVK